LRTLDEELWEMKFDKDKSEIGLLYGLIGKVRAMILLKEMLREGWIKPDADYNRFKSQLERVPAAQLPEDKRYNPLSLNPYVLYKALPQARRYSQAELIQAMDLLLKCNQRLVPAALMIHSFSSKHLCKSWKSRAPKPPPAVKPKPANIRYDFKCKHAAHKNIKPKNRNKKTHPFHALFILIYIRPASRHV
jgi:hypothetical protein